MPFRLIDSRLGKSSFFTAPPFSHPTGDVLLPFVTSHHSALGLGLSAVWGLVSSHGGYIDIPETVTGTRIDLYLPALP